MAPRRIQLCTFCKKHAIRVGIKNHIRNCPFKTCRCKCCEETRICQRFNRANTKNSRKPVGERTLTLPTELIELLGFEKRILDVVKEVREFCGRNDKKFGEIMFKWIEKGFDVLNSMQMSNSITINTNDPNAIQKHLICNGLSIEPAMPFTGYHQIDNPPFLSQNGPFIDINFGCEMRRCEYDVEPQMVSNKDAKFETTEMKYTPLYSLNSMPQVPEMILNDLSSSPQAQRNFQHEFSSQNHSINGSHLIELKSFSDNFHVDEPIFKKNSPASSSSSGSPRLPNFNQTFEQK